MITSFIRGRMRLRDPRFQDADTAATMAALIKDYPGVTKAAANPVTGSLLIEYDPDKLDLAAAREVLAQIDPEAAAWLDEYEGRNQAAADRGNHPDSDQRPPLGPTSNLPLKAAFGRCFRGGGRINKDAAEYMAMTGAFVICTSSAFLRSKGLHVYSGITLAGLTLQHIYKYRKRIFGFLDLQ